jgi:hypothetical protein
MIVIAPIVTNTPKESCDEVDDAENEKLFVRQVPDGIRCV